MRLRRSRPNESWRDSLLVFLEDLGTGGVPDWQIRQSADAVSLYYGQYQPAAVPAVPASLTSERVPFESAGALGKMRRLLELRHYAPSTLRSYLGWVGRYLRYPEGPRTTPPTSEDARAYLSHLATRASVSASTQNQAFNAILFLHRHVLDLELGDMAGTIRARRGRKLPLVLTIDEVRKVLAAASGTPQMVLEIIYGSGLRVKELVKLRVKDLDFDAGTITVRSGKGDVDRVTLLPRRVHAALRIHLQEVHSRHQRDLAAGAGEVWLVGDDVHRPRGRDGSQMAHCPRDCSEVDEGRRANIGNHQTSERAHPEAHLCHPLADEGCRHTAHPGTTGP